MDSLSVDVGGPIHYADWGGSGPPMVLVHGLGGSLSNWMAAAPSLARSHRVFALDLPGFGRTPPAGRSLSVEAQAATVGSFADRVAGSAPCVLVGNSMGGMISLILAARRPALVSRLVLVGSVLPWAPHVGDPVVTAMFLAYATPGLGPLALRSRRRMSPRRYVREFLSLCGVDISHLSPDVVDAMIDIVEYRRTTGWAEAAFLEAARSIMRWTVRPARHKALLAEVRCPTLVVHGTRDRLVSVKLARAAAKLYPRWDVEILEGVGHVPQLQVPERFAALVTSWLSRETRAA
jgi:pimeloyl-ACP methyl ester carboxylesterase